MALKVKDIASLIEGKAPLCTAEPWDNPGLAVGSYDDEIKGVMAALEVTEEVITEAYENDCNLLITHHPLLFKKPSSITMESLTGKKIISALKKGLNLYSAHTNLDRMDEGIADEFAKLLGFSKTFKPLDEISGDTHPYGRMAVLSKPFELKDIIERVKVLLKIESVRYCFGGRKISKIALINGSGSDFISFYIKAGADLIITGDMTHHHMADALEMGISVIDPGHYHTEKKPFENTVISLLSDTLMENNIKLLFSEKQKDPFSFS